MTLPNYDPILYSSKVQKQRKGNSMNHFIGWKFGVPVIVTAKYQGNQDAVRGEVRLIDENDSTFIIVHHLGGAFVCVKEHYEYELIPHRYSSFSPRYPVCQTPDFTSFCNGGHKMNLLDTTRSKHLQPYSTATLTIDGKTIELSAETTAELKKKLGV